MKERKRYVNFKTFKEMVDYMKRNKIQMENIIGCGWSYEYKHFFEVLE